MNSKLRLTIIVIFSILSFLLVFFLLSMFIFFLFFTKNDGPVNNTLPNKYSEISPSLNISDGGAVKLRRNLKQNEFVIYSNTKNLVLIAPFGGQEYECTGSCYCEEENSERRTSNILSRGLFIVLSSLTAITAIHMAKEIFHTNCVSQFSEICDRSRIFSEVNDCEDLITPEEWNNMLKKGQEKMKKQQEEGVKPSVDTGKIHTYICDGYCVKNGMVSGDADLLNLLEREVSRIGGCEKFQLTGHEMQINEQLLPFDFDFSDPKKLKFFENVIKGMYLEKSLSPFCERASTIVHNGKSITTCRGDPYTDGYFYYESSFKPGFCPNINCRKTQ